MWWDIFQYPWLLLAIAAMLFIVQRLFRMFSPQKCSNLYLLIPLLVAGLAFAIDGIVKTDSEKINSVVSILSRSLSDGDFETIRKNMTEDYRDDLHIDRDRAISHLKFLFKVAPIDKTIVIQKDICQQQQIVDVKIKAFLMFEKNAPISSASVGFGLTLEKQPATHQWLIDSSCIYELNKRQISWSDLP